MQTCSYIPGCLGLVVAEMFLHTRGNPPDSVSLIVDSHQECSPKLGPTSARRVHHNDTFSQLLAPSLFLILRLVVYAQTLEMKTVGVATLMAVKRFKVYTKIKYKQLLTIWPISGIWETTPPPTRSPQIYIKA